MTQRTRLRRAAVGVMAAALVTALTTAAPADAATVRATGAAAAARTPAREAPLQVRPAVEGNVSASGIPAPIPTSQCLAMFGIHCYSPLQFRTAYHLKPLYQAGITGAGRTIVVVDSFGSPTIRHDVDAFDRQWGLPAVNLKIVRTGPIPPFDPDNDQMVVWANESSLDVEYAHAIAPGARIILLETPVATIEGLSGLPEMMTGEKDLIDAGQVDVISQSFNTTENTFPGFDQGNYSSLFNLRYAFTDALRHHVTVLGSSGDDGPTSFMDDQATLYPFPANSWPSTDPLVTSVGGTQMTLDDAGHRLSPDTVWNDPFGASGGTTSQVFGRPAFQNGVRSVVGDHRGTPDISMSAAVDGGAYVYASFLDPANPWQLFGGTSESSPVFAGIVALSDQLAGHRLGDVNPALYLMGAVSQAHHPAFHTGLVDVTTGDNTFGGVTGYPATGGYDLATGWGTVDATRFVPALILATRLAH